MPTLDVPGVPLYVEKPDGTVLRVNGITGGRGIPGDPGHDGYNGPVILSDTAPTKRNDGTTLQSGDMWLDTTETPVYRQGVRNTWSASGTQTGPQSWVKPATWAWSVFTAPTPGVLQIIGWCAVTNTYTSSQTLGIAISAKKNSAAEAVIGYSGAGAQVVNTNRRIVPICATVVLAEKDIYRYAPCLYNAATSATCTVDYASLSSVFFPNAQLTEV